MDYIAAFDTLYTNNHIQICKLLLPSLPKDKQYLFAVFIKFWELHYVIRCGKNLICHPECDSGAPPDYQTLCKDILPYCNRKEADMVQKILQILNTLETVKTISPLLDLMKQMQSSSDGGGLGDFSSMPDISSLLAGGDLFGSGISPELFDMFGTLLRGADFGSADSGGSCSDAGDSSGGSGPNTSGDLHGCHADSERSGFAESAGTPSDTDERSPTHDTMDNTPNDTSAAMNNAHDSMDDTYNAMDNTYHSIDSTDDTHDIRDIMESIESTKQGGIRI